MTTNLLKSQEWQLVQTVQFIEIVSILESCKKRQRTGMIIGATGCGKTYTINKFCAKNSEHTYRITVSSVYRMVDILNELTSLLGIELQEIELQRMQGRSIKRRLDRIVAKLIAIKEEGGNPLIIFDEAENLEMSSLKMLKGLYDALEDHCGIVIIGTEQLMNKLTNKTKRNRDGIPQLYSRFRMGQKVITPFDKKRDFKPFFSKYITDKEVQAHLLVRCESYRDLRNAILPLLEEAERTSLPIDTQLFHLVHDN